MFKKSIFCVFLLGLFVSFTHAAIDPMNLPKLTQYVSDFSNVLDTQSLADLNMSAKSYDTQTSNQIVAVLIPNRNGKELFDIGMNIFDTNGIGQSDKDNGLLLVISTEEKKIRIIVWYGFEAKIPDLLASRIIEDDIRPLVNKWDFAGAVRAFYTRSISAISSDEWTLYTQQPSNTQWSESFWMIWLIFGVIFATLLKKKSFFKKWKWIQKYFIIALITILFILMFFLSITILFWFIAWAFFAFTGIISGFGNSSGSFGGWGFSWWGGSSGGGWAGD